MNNLGNNNVRPNKTILRMDTNYKAEMHYKMTDKLKPRYFEESLMKHSPRWKSGNNCDNLLSFRSYLKQGERQRKSKIYSLKKKDRLVVNYKIDDSDNITTVMKTDDQFFKIVSGRPSRNCTYREPIFRNFKVILNDLLRFRHDIGVKYDCILNIEQQFRNEIENYNETLEMCILQNTYFNKFLSEDYKLSIDKLNKSVEIQVKVDKKETDLEYIAHQQFHIASKIISLYYKYRLQQKYGRFLYYLSPPTWRLQHRDFARSVEIERMGFDLGQTDEDSDVFSVLYDIIQKELCDSPTKPVIYFDEPDHLIKVFTKTEQHYAHDFNQLMHLTQLRKRLHTGINSLQNIILLDCSETSNLVTKLKTLLKSLEARCSELKCSFYKIMNGTFNEMVCSSEILAFKVHLTFCFETVSKEDSEGRTLIAMAKYLEDSYLGYNKSLDKNHNSSVKKSILNCIRADKLAMRRAVLANRELRLANRMEQKLLQNMMPKNFKKSSTILTPNPSLSIKDKHIDLPGLESKNSKLIYKGNHTRVITEDDLEYLQLFTEWSEDEDPYMYLNQNKSTE